MPLAKAKATAKAVPAQAGPIHVLDIPYGMRGLAQAADATWDARAKAYTYAGKTLPESLHGFRAMPYSWEAYQEALLNGDEGEEADPEREVALRPHQTKAVAMATNAREAGHPGFLIADEVGLGKTIETWQAVLEMDDEQVLVVAPLSALANWRRTIRWMGDGGKTVVLINYDRLKRVFEVPASIPTRKRKRRKSKPRKVRTTKGIARFGKAMGFGLVVYDESHRLKNPESARTKLGTKLTATADFVFWLSATAGQDPLEIAYLAPILASRTGDSARDLAEYETWCQSKGISVASGAYGKRRWAGRAKADAEPEEQARAQAAFDHDLPLVRDLLYGGDAPVGLRRTPEDIAGWPAMSRDVLPIALDGADRSGYEQAWREFRRTLGLDAGTNSENGLVAQLRFRQKASLLRTASTVDLALDLIAKGHQVAISVQFLETLDILKAALEGDGIGVAEYSGRHPEARRERERLRFQRDEVAVCLYTVTEAINLHQGEEPEGLRPRANVIHDVRWSAIDMRQIEGRTHRDGKFSKAYWMVAEDTVDEVVAHVVSARVRSMGAMQGDAAMVAEIERAMRGLAA